MALPGVAAAERSDEAIEDAAEPVHFTGMLSPTGGGSDQEVAFGEGGVRTTWLAVLMGVHGSSDPRFDGTGVWRGTTDTYRANPSFEVQRGAYRIDDEDGAWQQVPTTLLTLRTADRLPVIFVFEGEGAYAGLVVVAMRASCRTKGGSLTASFSRARCHRCRTWPSNPPPGSPIAPPRLPAALRERPSREGRASPCSRQSPTRPPSDHYPTTRHAQRREPS